MARSERNTAMSWVTRSSNAQDREGASPETALSQPLTRVMQGKAGSGLIGPMQAAGWRACRVGLWEGNPGVTEGTCPSGQSACFSSSLLGPKHCSHQKFSFLCWIWIAEMNPHCSRRRNVGLWQNHIECLLVVLLGMGSGFYNVGQEGRCSGSDCAGPEIPFQITITPTFLLPFSVYNSTYKVEYVG